MNRLLLAGLGLAICAVFIYIVTAARNGKKPELVDAIVVFIGAVSVFGAIRLIGFVFTDQFGAIVQTNHAHSLWSLGAEDAVLVVIGGIALVWVSAQTMIESFAKVRGQVTPNPSFDERPNGKPLGPATGEGHHLSTGLGRSPSAPPQLKR